jgi:hypothetical protein
LIALVALVIVVRKLWVALLGKPGTAGRAEHLDLIDSAPARAPEVYH